MATKQKILEREHVDDEEIDPARVGRIVDFILHSDALPPDLGAIRMARIVVDKHRVGNFDEFRTALAVIAYLARETARLDAEDVARAMARGELAKHWIFKPGNVKAQRDFGSPAGAIKTRRTRRKATKQSQPSLFDFKSAPGAD
jgi:hypothetical protein